jgi:hypothetical protein
VKLFLLAFAFAALGYLLGLPLGAVIAGGERSPSEVPQPASEPSFQKVTVKKKKPVDVRHLESQLKALVAMPAESRPKGKLEEYIREWVKIDFHGALAFVKSLPPKERDEHLQAFCILLCWVDKAAAFELVKLFQDEEKKASTTALMIRDGFQFDVDEAFRVYESLPLETMDPSIFDMGSNLLNYAEPEMLGRIAARLDAGRRKVLFNQFFNYMFTGLSTDHVQRTLQAIQPTAADGGEWTELIMERLLRDNPEQATIWFSENNAGPMQDHALKGWSAEMRRSDPAYAMSIVSKIQDAELKRATITSNLYDWLRKDRIAAVEWLTKEAPAWLEPGERERWLRIAGAKR